LEGATLQIEKVLNKESYYFTAFCHIWGWATWKRVWDQYDFSLETIKNDEVENILRELFYRQ
jgi:hypothetical protein